MRRNEHPDAEFRPSPNFGERRGGLAPSMLILHYTGMESGPAAEEWLCDPRSEVSAHYLVHEDGRMVQLVPERARAWHAGKAYWKGVDDINSASIGIEIVNPGHAYGYPDFPDAQVAAVISLCKVLVDRWNIRPENVLAHSDVAPGRKIDPGEKFPWHRLHSAGIGHFVAAEPPSSDGLDEGEIPRLARLFARYGYRVPAGDACAGAMHSVIEAFQRHFRPARVDGIADRSTLTTLQALLADLAGRRD